MLGRYKRRVAKYFSNRNKTSFTNYIERLINNIPISKVNLDVVSFSGSKYLADQMYSLLSFYYNVGCPVSWKIFNDGTYTEKEKALLTRIPGVKVLDFKMEGVDEAIGNACQKFPTLKKMLIFQKIAPVRPTVLTDSDVLFYKSFKNQVSKFSSGNWYIVDEGSNYFDKDYLEANSEIKYPLNLGFIVINNRPDWDVAFSYIRRKIETNDLDYWTDQTATHIMASEAGNFHPLDKELFVNDGPDSFAISNHFDYSKIAVRHFVSPIRHKMWQYHWKKVIM